MTAYEQRERRLERLLAQIDAEESAQIRAQTAHERAGPPKRSGPDLDTYLLIGGAAALTVLLTGAFRFLKPGE